MIYEGDCLDVMAGMEPESIDAIITDPPYDLTGHRWDSLGEQMDDDKRHSASRQRGGFMGKAWDGTGVAFRRETWAEAFRVARPSSYLLAFGGTRTVHRMTVAIEDAGWIIRDMLVWAYASGFPKSKASLKPAWEPIVMARKPGPLRMLAIDDCRIPMTTDDADFVDARTGTYHDRPGPAAINVHRDGEASARRRYADAPGDFAATPGPRGGDPLGRWPANVMLTDEVFGAEYSRFFLVPKADRGDREPVLGGLPERVARSTVERHTGNPSAKSGERVDIPRQNVHPTVKPTDLMRHLVRLVTPQGGTVLDPFLGSGTTGLACELEGFPWIGIEREAEYVAIAEARLNGTQRGLGLSA